MNIKLRTGTMLGAILFTCVAAAGFGLLRPAVCNAQATPPAPAGDTIPLPLKLPKAVFAGTVPFSNPPPGVEKITFVPRKVPLVPKGTVNLALHTKVTSSAAPFGGSLDMITDGVKDARDDTAVELKPHLQWVQIDLGASHPLSFVVVWHYHLEPIVVHDVVVQLSDDPKFVDGVTTIYNNDQENTSGLGIGKDREYFETHEGRLIDAKNTKARYVRLYSNGSTHKDPLNRYTEVEVYGLPN